MNYRVVLVDDMPEIRQVLRLILEHAGPFEVVGEGSSGREAVSLAAGLQPDLLVMDVEMRGGPTGWEVLPQIRDAAPTTAVVILSGSAVDPMQSDRASLADGVLEKGLPPQELNEALLGVLAGRRGSSATPGPAADAPSGVPRPAMGDLEAFASVASHDLAQPLQVAYGYLEMVKSEFGEELDETALEWVDAALASLERMRLLVQDILAFARGGSQDVTIHAVSLEEAARSAIGSLEDLLAASGAEVRLQDGLPTVDGNEGHVAQVLEHLIANAVRFTPVGVEPVVVVSAERTGSEWIVAATDNGSGISPEAMERVFEPFYRDKKAPGRGTGLGLSTCRKLVERMGGRIWVEPRPEGTTGAEVRFALPIRTPSEVGDAST